MGGTLQPSHDQINFLINLNMRSLLFRTCSFWIGKRRPFYWTSTRTLFLLNSGCGPTSRSRVHNSHCTHCQCQLLGTGKKSISFAKNAQPGRTVFIPFLFFLLFSVFLLVSYHKAADTCQMLVTLVRLM